MLPQKFEMGLLWESES